MNYLLYIPVNNSNLPYIPVNNPNLPYIPVNMGFEKSVK